MWVRLLTITSLFLGLMLLVCKLPTPPPGPENSFVALEFKSSSGKITKDNLTDSIGKQVNICMIHNLTQYIDSSVLKITKGADFNAIHQIRSFKGQLDTTFYPVIFSVPGDYAVIFIGYIQGQPTVLNGTITIMGQQTTQNQKPVLTLSKEIKTGAVQELVIPVSATDPDMNQQVTITVIKKPETATFNANLFKWTPALADTGSVTVIFTATDNGSPALSTTDTCVIVVSATPVNRAPQWSIKTIQRSTLPEVLFSLDVSSYCIDPDNDNLTFSLLTKAPAKDTIAGNLYQFTPTVSDTGVHTISIVASDPAGLTDTLTLELTISTTIISKPDMVPPVITIRSPSNDTVISVDSFELKVTCVDDSGCSVSGYCDGKVFTMVKVPSVPNLWTGMVKELPSCSFATIKLIATDSATARNSDSVTVRIKYDGDTTKPTLTRVTPAGESASTNASSYTITVNCTDASGVSSVVGTMGTQTFTGIKGTANAWTIAVTGLSSTAANAIVITATDSSLRANKATLDFSITSDPTMLDTIGPTITDISGPVSGSTVTVAVVDIVKEISDPSGIDSVYWTHNGIKKMLVPVVGKTGSYSLKDTLHEGVSDTLVITAIDKSSNKNYSQQVITLTYILPPSITKQPVSQTVCSGSQAIFSVAATGTAPLSYQWRKGAAAPFSNVGSNSPVCTLSVSDATILSCLISNTASTSAISSLCTLSVNNPAGTPTGKATPDIVLLGDNKEVTLSVTSGNPGTGGSWVWYESDKTTKVTKTPLTPTATASYYVRSENAACGTGDWSSAVQVTVNQPAGTPSGKATPSNVCLGDLQTVTLSVASGEPGTGGSWVWYTSDKATKITANPFTPSASGISTYYVRSEGSASGDGAWSAGVQVTVNQSPVVPVAANRTVAICSGSSTTLGTTGTAPSGVTWRWYTTKTPTSSSQALSSLTVSPQTSTTYYVRGETSACGNSGWDSVQITVNSAATKPVLGASSTTSCSGDPVTLKVNTGNPGTNGTWVWYTDASLSSSSKVGTGTSIDVNPSSTTTYYVHAEGGTCPNTAATANIAITVNSRSIAPTGISSSENPVCPGSQVTLTIAGGVLGTNASWQWFTNSECTVKANGTRGGTNGSTLTTTIDAQTTFYVRAEGGCNTTTTAYTTVSVVTPITFTTNPASTSCCNNFFTTLSVVASGGGTGQLNYQWKRNGIALTNGTNYKNTTTKDLYVVANEFTIGDFTCTVDNGNGCSKTSTPATLSIESSPLTITSPSNQTECDGGFIGWDITVTGGSGNYTYQWYVDDLALVPVPDQNLYPDSRTLYITPVHKTNEGRYHCVVNDADNPSSCPVKTGYATITVTDSCP
jgi:hypothetical protein